MPQFIVELRGIQERLANRPPDDLLIPLAEAVDGDGDRACFQSQFSSDLTVIARLRLGRQEWSQPRELLTLARRGLLRLERAQPFSSRESNQRRPKAVSGDSYETGSS